MAAGVLLVLSCCLVTVDAGWGRGPSGSKQGGCRGRRDGRGREGHTHKDDHHPPRPHGGEKPEEPRTPLTEEELAGLSVRADLIWAEFGEHAPDPLNAVWESHSDDPQKKITTSYRLLFALKSKINSPEHAAWFSNSLWNLVPEKQERYVDKWNYAEGKVWLRLEIAMDMLLTPRPEHLTDGIKDLLDSPALKEVMFDVTMEAVEEDWLEAGLEGPSAEDATKLLMNCLEAKGELGKCELQYNWTKSCSECELDMAIESAQRSFSPLTLGLALGSAALALLILILGVGYYIGRLRERRRSAPSAVAPAPSAIAEKLAALEACQDDKPTGIVDGTGICEA